MKVRPGFTLLLLCVSACTTSDPAAVIADAKHKLATGQRAQAIFELKEFARKRPTAGNVSTMLARLLFDQGDMAGARQALDKLDAAAAMTQGAILLRVELALAERRPNVALAELDAHGSQLDAADRAVQEARALLADHRPHDAIECLQRALSAQPDSTYIATNLASVQALTGDVKGALLRLEDMTRRHPDADALATLGSLELHSNLAVQAVQHLESAVAAGKSDWPPTRLWATQLDLGEAYLALHDSEKSKALLETLNKEIPNSLGVRVLAAKVAMLEGQPHDAVAQLEPLMRNLQAPPRIALLYVTALVAAGEREQALQVVGSMLNQAGGTANGDALMALGSAQAIVKDYASASSTLDQAYKLNPSFLTAQALYALRIEAKLPEPEAVLLDWIGKSPDDSAAHFLLGERYRETGRTADAIHEFDTAITHDSRNYVARNNLASMLQQSDPARAEALAREALFIAPQNPAVQDTLGWILLQNNKVGEALPLLAAAARTRARDETLQFHYASALVQAGRGAQAKMILESLLLGARDSTIRAGAHQLLESLRKPTQKRDG